MCTAMDSSVKSKNTQRRTACTQHIDVILLNMQGNAYGVCKYCVCVSGWS